MSATVALVCACEKPVTPTDCEAMVDHMGDVYSPKNEPDEARETRHRVSRSSPGHKDTVADCLRNVRRPELDCVMGAKSPDAIRKCSSAPR